MTAPTRLPLDLVELASPWTPTAAPSAEAVQHLLGSLSASAVPAAEAYGDAPRAPYTSFWRIPSTGSATSRSSSRLLLVAGALASILAVAFLLLRCFALLRAESYLRLSGSPSFRILAEEDDVFACTGSSGGSSPGESRRSAGRQASGGFGFPSRLSPKVRKQMSALTLKKHEAKDLLEEELLEVASALGQMQSLVAKLEYHNGRFTDLSTRIVTMKLEQSQKEQNFEDGDEEDEEDLSIKLVAVEEELKLEQKELETVTESLRTVEFREWQGVASLYIRGEAFVASGRYISAPVAMALVARSVVLGSDGHLPKELSIGSRARVGIMVTELVLQARACRSELERLHSSYLGGSRRVATLAEVAAPAARSGRGFLKDLQSTASLMQSAGIWEQVKSMETESANMRSALEAVGLSSPKGSPSATKRTSRTSVFDFKTPWRTWWPSFKRSSGRSPPADFLLTAGQSKEGSPPSRTTDEPLSSLFQSKVSITSSSRSADDAMQRAPRLSTASYLDGKRKGKSGMQHASSFPELFSNFFGFPSGGVPAPTGPPRAARTSRGSAPPSPEPFDEDSEESFDAAVAQAADEFWRTGRLPQQPLSSGGSILSGADMFGQRGVKTMQRWAKDSEAALGESGFGYAEVQRLKYQVTAGKTIMAAWSPAREASATARLEKELLEEVREQLGECETMMGRLIERLVERATSIITSAEGQIKDALRTLEQAMARSHVSALNRVLYGRVILGVAEAVKKAQKTHETYSRLAEEVPEVSKKLNQALLGLAKSALETASRVDVASLQATSFASGEAEEEEPTIYLGKSFRTLLGEKAPGGAAATGAAGTFPRVSTTRTQPRRAELRYAPPSVGGSLADLILDPPGEGGARLMASAGRKASNAASRLHPR
ncbi:hypothetical protein, conserved [Eimeria acervulina]|uniref:Uncharacterized protein n=1 Tax=Eimeria acervulina TaxID=5801 RepID=U6GKZ3_EIMAC|nr:hypothetical protein, conserved [Eimeria acervulina]CDI79953.1 hypothetical protein, conserved [Eimeria acervulina]